MASMKLNTFGWATTVALGVGLLFVHIHPGNLDVVRFSVSFTLIFSGGRELWRIHRNPVG